ncbi:unnamed protein product, partial [Brenthis ino]
MVDLLQKHLTPMKKSLTTKVTHLNSRKAWISEETWKAINEKKRPPNQKGTLRKLSITPYQRGFNAYAVETTNQYLNSICEDIEDHARTLHTKDPVSTSEKHHTRV